MTMMRLSWVNSISFLHRQASPFICKIELGSPPPTPNSSQETVELQVLTLIIPYDRPGALETFLLQLLAANDADDQHVVESALSFIAAINTVKYLQKEREKVKAELAATFAVMFPETQFRKQIERMRSILWGHYASTQQAFQLLDSL